MDDRIMTDKRKGGIGLKRPADISVCGPFLCCVCRRFYGDDVLDVALGVELPAVR